MSPAEQDTLFESSILTDLEGVPAEFLARARARTNERIERIERLDSTNPR